MMHNQHLRILAQAVTQELVQQISILEQKLNQQENYLISNVIQYSEIAHIKQEIEKLVIQYQSLLILKYLKEAISRVAIQLDMISFQISFVNQNDDIKCCISTIKYLSSFITNIVRFPSFMEELNNCLQNNQSIDYTKTVAKRAYKLMKFQQLLCNYMYQFQKQKGIDLNKYYNIQSKKKRYKNYGKIKFNFKKQYKQISHSDIPNQCSLSTSQANSYSVTPQPQILGYSSYQQQSQSASSINQQNSCSSLISQLSQLEINPQINSFQQQQQNSLIYGPQVQNQPIYGISAIQQPLISENNSNYNYPTIPQSYYGIQTQTCQQPQEQYQKHLQFQIQPQTQQNQYQFQQQQVQYAQYQQSQQQQYQQELLKQQQQQQQQQQNSFNQQFNQFSQQPYEQQLMLKNIQSFQEDSIQQQVITDSIFQKSQSEISEIQNMSLQQYGFDNIVQPEKMLLDDASFQEQINQKEDVQKLQIIEQSEFEELVINKAKTTQILLDPQTNQQVFQTKQCSFIQDKSNQHDLESIKLLERFLERKQSQFEREDQKKQIQQLFDFDIFCNIQN